MKKILIILTAIGISFLSNAQTDMDALRFSQLSVGGTARGMGIGGAFGALGADFSSLSINPGGLGLYRSSEIMFTPSIISSLTQSEFISEKNSDRKYNFNFTNWGFVFNNLNYEKGVPVTTGWIGYSFAFGANRIANFHNRTYFSGFNTNNSLLDRYVQDVNAGGGTSSIDLDEKNSFPFGASLAWWAYLLNQDSINPNKYYSVIGNGNVRQSGTFTSKGAIDEYVLSFGANYNNKLYVGGTLGLPYLRYIQELDYKEDDEKNLWNETYYYYQDTIQKNYSDFQSFNLEDNLKTTGMGINFKFGMIYKATDWVRFGGAVHTPTYYSLTDEFSTRMSSSFSIAPPPLTEDQQDKPLSQGTFEYGLTTPWRLIGSAALIFKKIGFLSVDYEFVDYGQAFFNFKGSGEDKFAGNEVNQTILNKYGPASNIRIGGEVSYEKFRFRGGYGLYGTPFKSGIATGSADNSRHSISFGLGLREDDYYIDFGFVRTTTKEFYLPYSLSSEATEGVQKSISQNNFLMTFGLKF